MFKKSYSIASAPGLACSQKDSCLAWLVLGGRKDYMEWKASYSVRNDEGKVVLLKPDLPDEG